MPKSMMSYKEATIWLNDSSLLLILELIIKFLEIKITNNLIKKSQIEWCKAYKNQLKYYLLGLNSGAIDFEFESLKKDEYRFNIIFELLLVAKVFFTKADKPISAEQIKLILIRDSSFNCVFC